MREGTALHRTPDPTEGNPTAPDAPGPDAPGSDATAAGTVTSGGFGPSLGAPLAMGYLPPDIPDGATVWGAVRGRRLPARVVPLPFRPSTPKR
jgi:aminomethyltransferase